MKDSLKVLRNHLRLYQITISLVGKSKKKGGLIKMPKAMKANKM